MPPASIMPPMGGFGWTTRAHRPEAEAATDPVHGRQEDADQEPPPVQVERLVQHGLRVLPVDEREGKPGSEIRKKTSSPRRISCGVKSFAAMRRRKRSGARPPADRCENPKLSRKRGGHYSSLRHVGRHPDRQRTPAQPAGRHGGPAPPLPDRDHRPLGVGEIEPRLRYALRGGAAAVHRVALDLRQAVPRADAEAAGRTGSRASPPRSRSSSAIPPSPAAPPSVPRPRSTTSCAPVGADRDAVLPGVRRAGAARHGAVRPPTRSPPP
jgi:hypothetical protein